MFTGSIQDAKLMSTKTPHTQHTIAFLFASNSVYSSFFVSITASSFVFSFPTRLYKLPKMRIPDIISSILYSVSVISNRAEASWHISARTLQASRSEMTNCTRRRFASSKLRSSTEGLVTLAPVFLPEPMVISDDRRRTLPLENRGVCTLLDAIAQYQDKMTEWLTRCVVNHAKASREVNKKFDV